MKLRLELPGQAAIARALAKPAERVRRDVGEAPAHPLARVVGALLHNVLPARAAELARVVLLHRIAPENVPGIDAGVINAQRRAVKEAGQDPDVLDGATLQHPSEMNFARALVLRAVVGMDDGVHPPASDQPAVETHFVRAIGRRPCGAQRIEEGWGGHDTSHLWPAAM